eukprot:6203852-Pleurochrysis_carterae.AAC.3
MAEGDVEVRGQIDQTNEGGRRRKGCEKEEKRGFKETRDEGRERWDSRAERQRGDGEGKRNEREMSESYNIGTRQRTGESEKEREEAAGRKGVVQSGREECGREEGTERSMDKREQQSGAWQLRKRQQPFVKSFTSEHL